MYACSPPGTETEHRSPANAAAALHRRRKRTSILGAPVPFDGQGLTVTIAVLNRADGNYPVELVAKRRDVEYGVDFAGFYHHSSWVLRELLNFGAHTVGWITPTKGGGEGYTKIFPAVMRKRVEAYLVRKPMYYIFTLFIPLCLISFLASAQFGIDLEDQELWFDRVTHSATLLLTAAAYTSAVASSLPEIGCVWLCLDLSTSGCCALLAFPFSNPEIAGSVLHLSRAIRRSHVA